MLSNVKSMSLFGLNGYLIEVQIDISNGIPEFEIVGLPDTSVKEAKKRVRAAIKNSNIEFPSKKILVNLAPANLRKWGTKFDLSIAIGILIAMNKIPQIDKNKLEKTIFIGELSLNGNINRVNGILPICLEAKKIGIKRIFLPAENFNEASIIEELEVVPISSIEELVKCLNNEITIKRTKQIRCINKSKYGLDFYEVKGQENIKRGMEIVAAGGHNCLLIGSPGSGKTMIAKRLNTILPDLSFDEAIEITKLYSISGELKEDGLIMERPFRMPHHTTTVTTIIGGGRNPKPGEISLANGGVLFCDELPEYKSSVIEALREPMENKEILINRLYGNCSFPCKFIFVASMNPCPCGNYGDKEKECKCSEQEIRRYVNKISGPLLDRIDLHMNVQRIKYDKLKSKNKNESSREIKNRVNRARNIQIERYKKYNIYSNSEMSAKLIEKYCKLDKKGELVLKNAFNKLKLSVRSYEKILKVARTIADLEEKENIEYTHIAEALQYRSFDKKYDNRI